MRNSTTKICTREVKISQIGEGTKEFWNIKEPKVITAQVQVSKMLQVQQRTIYLTTQRTVILTKIPSEVELENMSCCVMTMNSFPITALFTGPKRESVWRIMNASFEAQKGLSFFFSTKSLWTMPDTTTKLCDYSEKKIEQKNDQTSHVQLH